MSADPAPTRLVLVRHGESNATVDRVVGGPRTCTGLSELGRRQVQALRDRLAETGELAATALYASAYTRARETAEIIAPAVGVAPDAIVIEPGFGEHDPGPDCDGLTFDEFIERHGMPDWYGDPHAVTFPGGETVAEFRHRVGAALSAATAANPGGTIVVSCHGGVVAAAFHSLLPVAGALELHTRNTSITAFTRARPDHWRLDRYNDIAHLAGLPGETPRRSTAG